MKIVALIPYWNGYSFQDSSIAGRDTISLSGKALINYPIALTNKIKKISETYIFTNDNDVKGIIKDYLNFVILPRSRQLDSKKTTIENIISAFLNVVDADIVVLLHPSSPFVMSETISDCLEKVINEKFDSSFLVRSEKKLAWYKNKRLNYDSLNGTPHLSDLEPVVLESSAAYIFSKETFIKNGTRIGEKPYIKEIGSFEGMVISSGEDIKIAEFLLDSRFFIGKE